MISLQARVSHTIPVKGLDTHDELIKKQGKPAEDLITIPLHDGNPRHVVCIGSNVMYFARLVLILINTKYLSIYRILIFCWNAKNDISGILQI